MKGVFWRIPQNKNAILGDAGDGGEVGDTTLPEAHIQEDDGRVPLIEMCGEVLQGATGDAGIKFIFTRDAGKVGDQDPAGGGTENGFGNGFLRDRDAVKVQNRSQCGGTTLVFCSGLMT